MKSTRIRIIASIAKDFLRDNRKSVLSFSALFAVGLVAGIFITINAAGGEFERIARADMEFGAVKVFFTTSFMVLGGVLLALVALVLSCLLKLALLKGVGGGKCKLYFGLVIDVYAEQPVKRNSYFLADFIAMLIPFCAIVVLMILFWNAIFFIAFAFLLINVIGNIPVYIFELKLPKDAFFWLNRGILYALKKV